MCVSCAVAGGYTPPVSYLGDRVKALRDKRGWSQEVLAQKAGVDKQTIFRIEKGGNSRHGTSQKLATALGVPHGQLIDEPRPRRTGRAEEDVQATLWQYPGLADHLGELLKGLSTMSAKDRTDFIGAVVALLTALEHASPAAGSGSPPNDGR